MTSITQSVYRGSYAGHPILFNDATTRGGRKFSKKEYPNRDDQNIQDLGLRPRDYDLEIVINAANPSGYFEARDSLLSVLEVKRPLGATLVHPLYGAIENMVATDWELTEPPGRLGEGVLLVSFLPTANTGIPESVQESLSGVFAILANANNAMAEAMATAYEVRNDLFAVPQAALNSVQDFVGNIRLATSFVGETTAQASGLATQLADISTSVNSLIQNPTQLATSMLDVFETTWGLFNSESDSLTSFENLFNYGANVTEFENYPSPAIEAINNNNAQVRNFCNGNALTGAYKAAIQLENTTVQSIDTVSARLDEQYQIVVNDPYLTPTVKNAIMDARTGVINYLNVLRETAAEEIEVYSQEQPARIISFNYYNNSSRAQEIVRINNKPDLSFISGNITILSD